jgi:hypothetical protein
VTPLNKQFSKCQAYIKSHIERAELSGAQPSGLNPGITISREAGTGAGEIGELLADHLNGRKDADGYRWTYFDKNLIKRVLEDHDLPARLEKFMPEDKPSPVLDAVEDMFGIHPPYWQLMKHTHDTISRLGKLGYCIIVGRGANIITFGYPNMLHVRLVGSPEKRVQRYMNQHSLSEQAAREAIKRDDRARRQYVLAYYDVEIDDPLNYHLVINVDLFSTDATVRLIGDALSGAQPPRV